MPARRRTRNFTDDDARLLELIAERIALAIRSAALIEAERAAQERLAFLSEASVALSSSLDLETTLRRTAQLATARFADCGSRRPRGRRLDLAGRDSRSRKAGCRRRCATGFLANPPSPDDDGGSARVIRTGLEEVLADLDTDPAPLAAVIRGRPAAAADARAASAARPRLRAAAGARPHSRCAGVDPYERELQHGRRRDRSRAGCAGRGRGRQRQPLQRRRTRT